LRHHSVMRGQYRDGLIIAASRMEQWETNLKSLDGELPAEVVDAIEHAWARTRPECPQYFRT